jgi:hypothetical protein
MLRSGEKPVWFVNRTVGQMMSNIPHEVEPLSLILALILFVFVSPILLAVVFSFLFFFVREFFIEPLVTSSMWRWVAPQTDWQMTSGIVESRVIRKRKRWYYLGKGGRLWLKNNAPYLEILVWRAHIEAIYLVDSKSHVLRPPLSFGDEFLCMFRDKAEELAAKYPDGSRATVSYDPANPQRASWLSGGNPV